MRKALRLGRICVCAGEAARQSVSAAAQTMSLLSPQGTVLSTRPLSKWTAHCASRRAARSSVRAGPHLRQVRAPRIVLLTWLLTDWAGHAHERGMGQRRSHSPACSVALSKGHMAATRLLSACWGVICGQKKVYGVSNCALCASSDHCSTQAIPVPRCSLEMQVVEP